MSFWEMGGYAAYVWPAYGISILALAVLVWASWRSLKRAERAVALTDADPRR